MKDYLAAAMMACTLGAATAFVIPAAWADDQNFRLTNGVEDLPSQYEAGSWTFKLTSPTSNSGMETPEIQRIQPDGTVGNAQSDFSNTEAAATYNLYEGSDSTPAIDLTGKVKVNLAPDKDRIFGLTQNDYAAQMDIYQSIDRFTAKGSLGSMVLGSTNGLTLNPLLYGSFGGLYQLTDQTSTGVDMNLSQDPSATGTMQQAVSAYVNYNIDKNFKARGYVLKGLTSGTPNNVVGGQVYYGF